MTASARQEPGVPSIVTTDENVVVMAADALRADGWSVARSWQLPESPWDLAEERRACIGAIDCPDAVAAVVLAAVRGAVVVVRCVDETQVPMLVDELSRVTNTERRDAPPRGPVLDDEQRDILEGLTEGATVAETAAKLFLSARTTERRLAAARKALGVSTTAEALTAFRKLR